MGQTVMDAIIIKLVDIHEWLSVLLGNDSLKNSWSVPPLTQTVILFNCVKARLQGVAGTRRHPGRDKTTLISGDTGHGDLSDQLLSIRPTRVNIGLRLPPVARSLPSLLCLVTFRSASDTWWGGWCVLRVRCCFRTASYLQGVFQFTAERVKGSLLVRA